MNRSKRTLLSSTKLILTPKVGKLCQKIATPNQKCSNLLLQQKHQNVSTISRHRLCQIPHEKTNVDQVLYLEDHIIKGHALQKQNHTICHNRRHIQKTKKDINIDDKGSYDIDITTTANMETNTRNNVNEKISQQTIENTKPMKVNEILLKAINSNSNEPR